MKQIFDEYRRWFVVLGLMLIYAASNGITVHTLPLLYPPLIEEFGWSSSQMTLPAAAFFIFGAVTSPPAGALFDRFPVRRVMLVGVMGLVLSLMCFPFISALWQMVTLYLIFGLALSLCGLTASMVILTKWFDDMRGRATGLLLMSSSFGGAVFPLILGAGIENLGWRQAIGGVSIAAALMTLPALFFLVSDRSIDTAATSDMGVEQDLLAKPALGPTFIEAIKSPTFYLLAFATGAMWFTIVALTQHQSIYLVKDIGIDGSILPKVFSVFFACSVIGKFGFGLLSDYVNKEISMVCSICLLTIGLMIVRSVTSDGIDWLFTYAVIAGIGFSGTFTTIQILLAKHFAGGSYGKILASIVMIDSLAGGIGTRGVGKMRDASGSYDTGWELLIALCVIAIFCTVIIRRLAHETDTTGTQDITE